MADTETYTLEVVAPLWSSQLLVRKHPVSDWEVPCTMATISLLVGYN